MKLFKKCKHLLELFKTERKVLLRKKSLPEDLEGLLERSELTEENLKGHKEAIKQMVGKVNEEEDKRYSLYFTI